MQEDVPDTGSLGGGADCEVKPGELSRGEGAGDDSGGGGG